MQLKHSVTFRITIQTVISNMSIHTILGKILSQYVCRIEDNNIDFIEFGYFYNQSKTIKQESQCKIPPLCLQDIQFC